MIHTAASLRCLAAGSGRLEVEHALRGENVVAHQVPEAGQHAGMDKVLAGDGVESMGMGP